jgi:hypothetical protein
MQVDLPACRRPQYSPGGGSAFVYFVVFGVKPPDSPLSGSKYRVAGIPPELKISHYQAPKSQELLDGFREGPLWDELRLREAGLAAAIAEQNQCVVIHGEFGDRPDLNYLRDTIGIATWFLDQGGVAVYDPQMFRFWSADDWWRRIFEPVEPIPRSHAIILVSAEEGGTEWVHTRGMRKFGRPDISIHGVAPDWKNAAVDVCNRFIEFQAFGGLVEEGREIRINGFPEGFKCYHRGELEDPDFNNVHLAIER